MEIYIEYLLIDNLIINMLIIVFSGFLTGGKYKKVNIFLSDLFGTTCAVFMPLISLNAGMLVLIKVGVGVVMVGLLKKYANFKEFFLTIIVFYTITFLFGGVCFGVNEMFGIGLKNGQLVINSYMFPVSLFCLFASGYFYLLFWLIKYFRRKNKLQNLYFDVTIKLNDKLHFLRGFLDTGNKLECNGDNVVLVPMKVFLKEFREYPIEKIVVNPSYLQVKTVGKLDEIVVVDVDEINIKNNEKNITMQNIKIGLSKQGFSSDFECLLGCEMLRG